jgi:hypothetical protein
VPGSASTDAGFPLRVKATMVPPKAGVVGVRVAVARALRAAGAARIAGTGPRASLVSLGRSAGSCLQTGEVSATEGRSHGGRKGHILTSNHLLSPSAGQ